MPCDPLNCEDDPDNPEDPQPTPGAPYMSLGASRICEQCKMDVDYGQHFKRQLQKVQNIGVTKGDHRYIYR